MKDPEKAEKTNITLTPSQKKKGRERSKELFGRVNLSAYIAYLIERD